MKKTILTILLVIFSMTISFAYVVGTTNYNGTQYYVDVQISGNSASVWLIKNKSMCTPNDIKVFNISSSNPTLKSAKEKICRAKSVIDDGKTILGCAATVASGACAAATVASDGATAVFCQATWSYTVKAGLKDCISGVSSKIANYLGMNGWAALATKAAITGAKWTSVIDTAIGQMCKDAK